MRDTTYDTFCAGPDGRRAPVGRRGLGDVLADGEREQSHGPQPEQASPITRERPAPAGPAAGGERVELYPCGRPCGLFHEVPVARFRAAYRRCVCGWITRVAARSAPPPSVVGSPHAHPVPTRAPRGNCP